MARAKKKPAETDSPAEEPAAKIAIEPTAHRMLLELDLTDAESVLEAMEVRMTAFNGLLPPGGGNLDGRVIAEICRGWLEMLRMPRDRKAKADAQQTLLPT